MAYDGFFLTYKQDTETLERFENLRELYPNIRLVKINLENWNNNKVAEAVTKLSKISNTKFFWIVDADIEVNASFDFNFQVNEWEEDVVHLWNAEERNVFSSIVGVKLFKKSDINDDYINSAYYMTGAHKLHEHDNLVRYFPTREYYDIFFWDQGYGYDTLEYLRSNFKNVKVVTGNSYTDVHQACRKSVKTELYYFVTANTELDKEFKFNYSLGIGKESKKIVVWKKANPITGLEREFHGVGLFPSDGKLYEEEDYKIWNFRRGAVYEKETIGRDREFPTIISDDLTDLSHDVDSDMYWLVSPDIKNLDLSFYPFQYDRETIHNFRVRLHNNKTTRGGVRLVPRNPDVTNEKDIQDIIVGEIDKPMVISASTLQSGLSQIDTYPALIVDPALQLKRSFSFYPDTYDTASAYTFGEHPGVVYVAHEYDEHSVKNIEIEAAKVPDYDIFFWDQGYGENNFSHLEFRYSKNRVKKITTDNILDAHKFASKQSTHEYYYLVSSDTVVTEDFNFDYRFEFSMTEKGRQQIVVWQKTDDAGKDRGYHGVGLFRKNYIEEEKFTESRVERYDFRKRALYIETEAVKYGEYDVIVTENLFDVDAASRADSDMVWMVHPDVETIDLSYKPLVFDRKYGHNFDIETPGGKAITNGVRLIPRLGYDDAKQKNVELVVGKAKQYERVEARTIEEAIKLAKNDTFWVVNPDLDLTTNLIDNFYPDLYETGPTHVWKFTSQHGEDLGWGGIALTNKNYHPENMIYHEEVAATLPMESRVPVFYSRDMYDVYKKTEGLDFYWVVDPVVELIDGFDFDFYPNIHQIENVFTFSVEQDEDSKVKSGSGVYLVYRPHLAEYSPSQRDFSFDKFKNMITIDRVVSRVAEHPAFYFDEGMYSENTKSVRDMGIEIIDATSSISEAYVEAANKTDTGYFWAIDNDVVLNSDFDKRFYVDRHNREHFHMWPKQNPYTKLVHQYGGLRLIPSELIKRDRPDTDSIRKTLVKGKKPIKADPATSDALYDVVFLSYNEEFADDNYEKLLKRVPNAKRVHGVKGIFNAHKQAAELADTRMFYVVDADAILLDEFEFQYYPSVWDEDIIHTWQSKNPINDLVYGYGGLKLFPTKLLRDATDWNIDFTTSVGKKFKPMPIVANYTAFNTDPFNTWKSAFRECTKLASSVIENTKQDETSERLEIWCSRGSDRKFGEYALAGANAGREFGSKYTNNTEELNKINDYEWLEEKFKELDNE